MAPAPLLAAAAVGLAVLAAWAWSLPGAAAAESLRRFAAQYDIQSDGTIVVTETIDYDFGSAVQHGLLRDLVERQGCPSRSASKASQEPITYACPQGSDRVVGIEVLSVESPTGAPAQFSVSQAGDARRIRIGDPDKTVTGAQTYVIRYRLHRALDRYPSHDELYWNVLGKSDVSVEQAEITVTLPAYRPTGALCFQGSYGSDRQCAAEWQGGTAARFRTVRALGPSEQMSIVFGWETGVTDVQPPDVRDRVSVDDFFAFDAWEFAGMALVGLGSAVGLAAVWWRHGRDRRYRTLYYLTNDPSEETKPLFGRMDVVVEYLPPDGLKPAQMGVILDERADTLDVTATIIDLAVRGYLHITEIPKEGLFGKKDWELDKLREADSELQPYEAKLFEELFDNRERVRLSSLKNTFAKDLARVKKLLYRDALERKWFKSEPEKQRGWAIAMAVGIIALGAILTAATGWLLGRALIGAPVVLAGVVMLALSPSMAKRTATGSEALRRVLGFRLYIATAETRRQEFNEQQNIFARYLPYAIVFGCVEKWAKAFEGIDDPEATGTASWYSGTGMFQVAAFSAGLNSFASSVSSSISSAPGSGGSGFSGGFSGGGGGGGGVGSW